MIVLVFEHDVERGERSVTAGDTRTFPIGDFRFLKTGKACDLCGEHERPALKPGFSGRHNHSESIRAASSDFEARRLLRQSARHRRERAPGTGPMLVPSLQRYQAYPLSKPRIDLCAPDLLSRSVRYQSISHRTDRTVLSGPSRSEERRVGKECRDLWSMY